ncbi:hypothetical protein SNEBB_009187 [Seison nebaliae]|nr:hypothetical protein SNEBB_009187 [Seison nebaliae]
MNELNISTFYGDYCSDETNVCNIRNTSQYAYEVEFFRNFLSLEANSSQSIIHRIYKNVFFWCRLTYIKNCTVCFEDFQNMSHMAEAKKFFNRVNDNVCEAYQQIEMNSLAIDIVGTFLVLFILITNLILLITISRNRRLHTTLNFFIVSLLLCDIFTAITYFIPSLINFLVIYSKQTFNYELYIQIDQFRKIKTFCIIMPAFQFFCHLLTEFILLSMALEKYFAAEYPFQYKKFMMGRNVGIVLFLDIVIAACVTIVPISFSNNYESGKMEEVLCRTNTTVTRTFIRWFVAVWMICTIVQTVIYNRIICISGGLQKRKNNHYSPNTKLRGGEKKRETRNNQLSVSNISANSTYLATKRLSTPLISYQQVERQMRLKLKNNSGTYSFNQSPTMISVSTNNSIDDEIQMKQIQFTNNPYSKIKNIVRAKNKLEYQLNINRSIDEYPEMLEMKNNPNAQIIATISNGNTTTNKIIKKKNSFRLSQTKSTTKRIGTSIRNFLSDNGYTFFAAQKKTIFTVFMLMASYIVTSMPFMVVILMDYIRMGFQGYPSEPQNTATPSSATATTSTMFITREPTIFEEFNYTTSISPRNNSDNFHNSTKAEKTAVRHTNLVMHAVLLVVCCNGAIQPIIYFTLNTAVRQCLRNDILRILPKSLKFFLCKARTTIDKKNLMKHRRCESCVL